MPSSEFIPFFFFNGSQNWVHLPIFFTPWNGGMSECDLVHRRSVAVLCMLYKIKCNPLRPLCGALPVIAHRQDFYSLVSISVERSRWPRIRWCVTGWFQEQGQYLFIALAARSLFISCCFPFLFFQSICWYCGAGLFVLIGRLSLSPILALPTLFNDSNNNTIPTRLKTLCVLIYILNFSSLFFPHKNGNYAIEHIHLNHFHEC